MSHKCGELDKQVPYLMGVSKAIMENVIFCHQVVIDINNFEGQNNRYLM